MDEIQFEHILSKEYDGCTANFLKLGNAGVMFDWGIDDEADPKNLATYDSYMEKVDVILLTHATFRHCGALPYLRKKYDFSNISVYATFPVNKLASTCMYEYYIGQKQIKEFDLFSIEDIDEAFADVKPVSFHQKRPITVNDSTFTITALNAGYSLGGAIWVIKFMMHKLIYAIDVNDKNESITEPLQISELRDAHFLVTNTYIAPSIDGKKKSSRIQPTLSKERLKYHINNTLLQHLNFETKTNQMPEGPIPPREYNQSEMEGVPISEVLMNYGLVGKDTDYNSSEYPCAGQYDAEILICCDNFSRVLEVLLFLEDFADQNPDLQKVPILYLEHMSKESLEIAKSHIEWMNNRLKSTFVYIDINPMNFKSIKVLSKEEELQNYPNPRIVISSSNTFQLGHARNLLPKVLTNRKSKLIFINKQLSHPLGPQLIKQDMRNYTHKKVTVTKQPKQQKDVEIPEPQGVEDLQIYTNAMDVEVPEEKPQDGSTKHDQQKDQEMQVEEDHQFDLEAYNARLFAKSDYPMFAYGEDEDPENRILVDAYGVFTGDEADDDYLDRLATNLNTAGGFMSDGLDGLGGKFGTASLNNSVAYEYIKDMYNSYDFIYNTVDENVAIDCQTAYIPFEGRIDKKSFQIMLCETRPKNLIIVNASNKKVERIKDFVNENRLKINVAYVEGGAVSFKIPKESAEILLEASLVNNSSKALKGNVQNPNSDRYSVNRIFGRLKWIEDANIEHQNKNYILQDIGDDKDGIHKKEHYLFESKSLFFKDVGYRLSDLQKYLSDNGISVTMINKKLNYNNKVEIFQDGKGELHVIGQLCEEYITIRKLIYDHFGRV